MLIFSGDITLDASGHGEADLTGLTDVGKAHALLLKLESMAGEQGSGSTSGPASGTTSLALGAKPDGAEFAKLFIDNGVADSGVRALVWQE